MAVRAGDPGLLGVVPFSFDCHRCGHCCSGGSGYIWVEDSELEALAAAKGMELAAFADSFLRRVHDPRTGAKLDRRSHLVRSC